VRLPAISSSEFACSQCSRQYQRQGDLTKHRKRAHAPNADALEKRPADKVQACMHCAKRYSRKSDLTKHIWRCHPDPAVGFRYRYALTFANCEEGWSRKHLENLATQINEDLPGALHLIDLALPLQPEQAWPASLTAQYNSAPDACVLLIKGGVRWFMDDPRAADGLFGEQLSLPYEGKFFDKGRTFTRRSYKTLKFGDAPVKRSADYSQPTVYSFGAVPHLQKFLGSLSKLKASLCSVRGVEYFVSRREKASDGGMMACASRLGWHGDHEPKAVSLSLGHAGILKFSWRLPGTSANFPNSHTEVILEHGDMYLLSEKASGRNWKKRSLLRVVHSSSLLFKEY